MNFLKTLFFLAYCLTLFSCKENQESATKAKQNNPLIKLGSLSDCSNFSSEEALELLEMETIVMNATIPWTGANGEYHKDALHNILRELSKRGCSSSIEPLISLLEKIDNYFVENQLQSSAENRLMEPIFVGLKHIGINRKEIISILEKVSKNDIQYPLALRNLASDTIKYLTASKSSEDFSNYLWRYRWQWNEDNPQCSTSFLMVDGSRSSISFPELEAYLASVTALSPSSDILIEYLYEPYYCDGHDGYETHRLAAEVFASAPLDSRKEEVILSVLQEQNFRGTKVSYYLIAFFDWANHVEMFQIGKWLDLLQPGENYIKDEVIREEIIKTITKVCQKRRKDSICVSDVLYVFDYMTQTDSHYNVRLEAKQSVVQITSQN